DPLALAVVGLQGGGRRLLVAPAEGARERRVGLHRCPVPGELAGPVVTPGGDGDPPAGEGVESELAHHQPWPGRATGRRARRGGGTTIVDTAPNVLVRRWVADRVGRPIRCRARRAKRGCPSPRRTARPATRRGGRRPGGRRSAPTRRAPRARRSAAPTVAGAHRPR